MSDDSYEILARRVGALVDKKNKAYGNSFDDCGEFLKLLYPNGIEPNQYNDALCLVRIFDKMKRIATDRDALGESPYQDITGYGLLGLRRVERERAFDEAMGPMDEEVEEEPEEPKKTMGEALSIQHENPMFPPLVQGLRKSVSADQQVRIPARRMKGGA